MTVVASLTGLFPPIVAGGIALKFTEAALGNGNGKGKARRGKRLSNKYGPF